MRRSWIPVAAAVLVLLAAAPARAGTYDVVSCGAPGAGGVNWSSTAPAGTRITRLVTRPRGRWSVSYGFSGRPGTYPVRVRIRRQALFPFVLGTSPTVRVRVR